MNNLIILAVLMLAGNVLANRYWVSSTGTATYANAKSSSPLSGTSCTTIHLANLSCAAGDTIYMRAGTYSIGQDDGSTEGIHPAASGSAGNRILFKAYNGESVTLVGNTAVLTTGVNLSSQSYITVSGINSRRMYHHMYIGNSSCSINGSYNEIANDTFSGMYDSTQIDYRGSTICGASNYNWIHDCLFERYGNFFNVTGTTKNGEDCVPLEVGYDDDETNNPNYNVIENNTIQYGGHHTLGVHGIKNVIRGNYVQNAPWFNLKDTLRGERNMYMLGFPNVSNSNLMEGNRIAYGGNSPAPDHVSGEGGLFGQSYDIFRYNEFVRTDLMAMFLHVHETGYVVDNNCVYQNTFWHCGWDSAVPNQSWKENWGNEWTHAMYIFEQGGVSNTHVKNNLFYQNRDGFNASWEIVGGVNEWNVFSNQDIGTNWLGVANGDPKFVSISASPLPETPSQYNLALQSNSGAINGGVALTTATNSGSNSTSLIVAVPYYFQDGWGNGAGGGAVVQADWIAIGTVSNTVQISSINYNTKTITLASPKTWANNAPIWLYKKSDGSIVLHGTAPDFGAHECFQPPPLTNLRIAN